MDSETYQQLYNNLATRQDLERLVGTSPYDDELLLVIHTQRVVRDATKRFYKVKNRASHLHRQWKRGASFVDIADEIQFPPVLTALHILGQEGVSRKRFWKMINEGEGVKSRDLARQLEEVCEADLVYSPEGTERQNQRGAWGERRLQAWLDARGVTYRTEEDLRDHPDFDKTPDALLDEPLGLNGYQVSWIESKASFGDPYDVKRHIRRQLRPYVDRYGAGIVVYWFGYVEDADLPIPDRVAIVDQREFEDEK